MINNGEGRRVSPWRLIAWTHYRTSSASWLVVSSIFCISGDFLSPRVLIDLLRDSKFTVWQLLLNVLSNRLLTCQPGKCKANPLSQRGIKFICSYLRFLPSRMRGQRSWKAAVMVFFLTLGWFWKIKNNFFSFF